MNKFRHMFFVVALCSCTLAQAQRHFYHRVDVGSSNIYTFVVSNLITGYTNYLTHDILFDDSYSYSLYNGRLNGEKIKTKGYNPMGITARELFNDAFAGVKLGYQSDYMGPVNWGIYTSAHYKINQFKVLFPFEDGYNSERAQYLKTGGGLFLTFGSIESITKVQVEAALRYDMPLSYAGIYGNDSGVLNRGVSSHFAVKVGGFSWLSAGVYADFNHYDLYKNMGSNSTFKQYNVGVTFTITPKRGEDLYD